MNIFFGFVVSVIYIVIIMICGIVFEKAGKEASRKFIHIMLANWWIIAMVFFTGPVTAAILPGAFIIINYLSYKNNIIKVMERDEGDSNKDSLGTVYYAITLFVLAIVTFGPLKNPLIGLVGVAAMGYGDGLAAVIGQALESPKFKIFGSTKSVAGCAAMFVVSLMIMAGFLWYSQADYVAVKSIIAAAALTVVEACSIKGTDNLSVPLLASVLAFILV